MKLATGKRLKTIGKCRFSCANTKLHNANGVPKTDSPGFTWAYGERVETVLIGAGVALSWYHDSNAENGLCNRAKRRIMKVIPTVAK